MYKVPWEGFVSRLQEAPFRSYQSPLSETRGHTTLLGNKQRRQWALMIMRRPHTEQGCLAKKPTVKIPAWKWADSLRGWSLLACRTVPEQHGG